MAASARQNLNNAGIKVTDLPIATTPLTGTETFMLVQDGLSKQVAATDLPGGTGAVGFMTVASPAGVSNNVALPGFNPYTKIVDVATNAGNAQWTGMLPGVNGQRVVITNTGPNQLRLDAMNAGSAPANQFREGFNTSLLTNTSIELLYSTDVNKWLVIP